jgi:hypothetical protein
VQKPIVQQTIAKNTTIVQKTVSPVVSTQKPNVVNTITIPKGQQSTVLTTVQQKQLLQNIISQQKQKGGNSVIITQHIPPNAAKQGTEPFRFGNQDFEALFKIQDFIACMKISGLFLKVESFSYNSKFKIIFKLQLTFFYPF